MAGVTNPPITQRIVRTKDGQSLYVNGWTSQHSATTVAEAIERLGASEYVIEGRRRLNDYVGSPIWSDWEPLDGDA